MGWRCFSQRTGYSQNCATYRNELKYRGIKQKQTDGGEIKRKKRRKKEEEEEKLQVDSSLKLNQQTDLGQKSMTLTISLQLSSFCFEFFFSLFLLLWRFISGFVGFFYVCCCLLSFWVLLLVVVVMASVVFCLVGSCCVVFCLVLL